MRNPGNALEVGDKIGVVVVATNTTGTLRTIPDVKRYHHTSKGLYLGTFVYVQV